MLEQAGKLDTGQRMCALVVDDEPLARKGMRSLLRESHCFSRVIEARHGAEAVRMIREELPDIVFLDVQMPGMDGFQVLKEIGTDQMPAVVFVTAHDRYAVQAFEMNAIDYLLKPVARERFAAAVRRIQGRHGFTRQDGQKLLSLLQTVKSPPRYLARLAIRAVGKTQFVNVDDVDWIQAAENYVCLYAGPARYLVHMALQTLHDSLDPAQFLRIHRSLIVNVSRIVEVQNAGRGQFVVVLRSGDRLESSRGYHDVVKQWMNNPT
ncbi:MAG TPA: LytTR family DNA-binding domain-containing protein [Steroidobacteraceae bacterium]|nr:LytTR family DNA-binding domain-containing protein [Steroidobacteraceae bacterium]